MLDDYVSGSSGPGFVGLLLGLAVLIGFGALVSSASDSPESDWLPPTVGKRITRLQSHVQESQLRKAEIEQQAIDAGKKTAIGEQIDQLLTVMPVKEAKQAVVGDELKAQKTSFGALEQEVKQHRDMIRAAAVGKVLGNFQTLDGRSYEAASITEVSDIGVSIRHATGIVRVSYENLPKEWRKRFRYSADEHRAASAEESINEKKSLISSDLVRQAEDSAPSQSEEKHNAAMRKRRKIALENEIAMLRQRVAEMRSEHNQDVRRVNAGRSRGNITLSRASQISRDLRAVEEKLMLKESELRGLGVR